MLKLLFASLAITITWLQVQTKIIRAFPHFTANFSIADSNSRLISQCIENTTVHNIQGCVGRCIQNPNCTTFNFHKIKGICELFKTSKFDGVGCLRLQVNWVHYETDNDAKLVSILKLSPFNLLFT